MPVHEYQRVSILSYSPIAGIRRATGIPISLLEDADARSPKFLADANRIAALTKQNDPKSQLIFGFWAVDHAPTEDLRERIPLEVMIIHYVRTLPAWSMLGRAPALNIVTLDWPVKDGYEVRAYLFGSESPFPPEQLRFFYEQQKERFKPEISQSMPNPGPLH